MTTDRQKAAERRTAERFLTTLYPDRVWKIESGEQPDFVVRIGGASVGLELSNLYRNPAAGPPRQMLESLRSRICSQATRLWEDLERPSVEVWMLFEPYGEIRKRDVENLAQRVTAVVAQHLPPHGDWAQVDHADDPPLDWPQQINSITISRRVEYDRTYWHANDSSWIPNLTVEHVQDALAAKNAKAERYDGTFGELWLLLSMHQGRLSSTFDIPAETRAATYQSTFHRVFLFEEVATSIVELNVEVCT